jgi:hypothetical protein
MTLLNAILLQRLHHLGKTHISLECGFVRGGLTVRLERLAHMKQGAVNLDRRIRIIDDRRIPAWGNY